MSKLTSLICAAVLALTGCDNALEDSLLENAGEAVRKRSEF